MEKLKIHSPYVRKLDRIAQQYNGKSTSECGIVCCWRKGKKWVWKKKWFESALEVPFEMITIPVPNGFDSILSNVYGDWHKYVIGRNQHGDIIFDVDLPFTEYLKRNRIKK